MIAGQTNKLTGIFCFIFLLVLILIPHNVLIHHFLPIVLFDKSIILLLLAAFALLCTSYFALKDYEIYTWIIYLVSLILFLLPILIRAEFYPGEVLRDLIRNRSLLAFPLAITGSIAFLRNETYKNIALKIIIVTGVLQCVVGLLHMYIFPEFVTGASAALYNKFYFIDHINGSYLLSRESGTLRNPTYYANFILLSLVAFLALISQSKKVFGWKARSFHIIVSLFLLMGCMLSLNRLTLIYMLGFLFFSFQKVFKDFFVFKITIPAVVGGVFLYKYPHFIHRFQSEGLFGRSQTYEALFTHLTSSWTAFFIGIPNYILADIRSLEGYPFSDNSFLLMWTQLGFPLFILWLSNLIFLAKTKLEFSWNWFNLFFIFYLVVNCFLTEIFYCDSWVLFSSVLLAALFNENNKKEVV